ncbi:MAG: F0F1 ATP synthase subunit delta [Ruminococcaceae bacterium]|jgi:F0F1-type ATP synthase delta subunit|nr:F0F1 ATP synthase subunit delta [Oscillospiraceae bacterium]
MKKAVITVCESMSENTYSTLLNGIKKKFGEDISVTKQVDPSLIGGFILTVDGVVYDNSVSSFLNEIKKELID